jgi:hypothetical protein
MICTTAAVSKKCAYRSEIEMNGFLFLRRATERSPHQEMTFRSPETKRVQKQELSLSDIDPTTQSSDMYLEVDLKLSQYAIRSFAFGGRPYFQVSGVISSKQKVSLIEDIFSCKLTQDILNLFDGLNIDAISEMPCLVTDARKSLPVKFRCTLIRPADADTIVKVWHARSFSAESPAGALLSEESNVKCDEDEECSA